MATLSVRRGAAFFAGTVPLIGYWPWELNLFPEIWTAVYELVDEIWTGSEFTANAYRANCTEDGILSCPRQWWFRLCGVMPWPWSTGRFCLYLSV